MCEPTTIAVLAIGVMSTVMTTMSGMAQAKQARKDENANTLLQFNQRQEIYDETNRAASDAKSARAREAKIEQGRLRVITGESGLAGNSNDKILEEGMFNEGFDIATIEANRQSQLKQIQMDAQGDRAASNRRANQIQSPSLIGAGLQIAGHVAGAASTSAKLNAPRRGVIK